MKFLNLNKVEPISHMIVQNCLILFNLMSLILFQLTENIFPYCVLGGVYVDLSKNYVPAEMKVSLKLCEIQNNNLNEISAGVG